MLFNVPGKFRVAELIRSIDKKALNNWWRWDTLSVLQDTLVLLRHHHPLLSQHSLLNVYNTGEVYLSFLCQSQFPHTFKSDSVLPCCTYVCLIICICTQYNPSEEIVVSSIRRKSSYAGITSALRFMGAFKGF